MLPSQFHSPRFFHHWRADWRCAGRDSGTELFNFDSTNTSRRPKKVVLETGPKRRLAWFFTIDQTSMSGIPRFYHFNVGEIWTWRPDQIRSVDQCCLRTPKTGWSVWLWVVYPSIYEGVSTSQVMETRISSINSIDESMITKTTDVLHFFRRRSTSWPISASAQFGTTVSCFCVCGFNCSRRSTWSQMPGFSRVWKGWSSSSPKAHVTHVHILCLSR